MARTRKLNLKQKKKVIKKTKVVRPASRLVIAAARHLWANKKPFGLITAIYFALYMLLVKGLIPGFQLSDTKQTLEAANDNGTNKLTLATSLLSSLVGTTGSVSSEAGGIYQAVLLVLISLAVIWTLRQTYDNRRQPKLREIFYQCMYPLIQYVLVGLVIVLHLLPMLIGATVYGIVTQGGIAINAFEQITWFLVLVLSISATVYLVSSSLFASYIITLPGMTPLKALRTARKLVRFRRFMVIRKLLFLPLAISIVLLVVFLPLVLYIPLVAEILFLVFMLSMLVYLHAYFYILYRELL